MKDAVAAVLLGAAFLGACWVTDAYGERRWPGWVRQTAYCAVLLLAGVVIVEATDKPAFALIGVAIVVAVTLLARGRREEPE